MKNHYTLFAKKIQDEHLTKTKVLPSISPADCTKTNLCISELLLHISLQYFKNIAGSEKRVHAEELQLGY